VLREPARRWLAAAGVTGFAFGCADYCDKSSIWQLEHHLGG
jgi:hypothetical protein